MSWPRAVDAGWLAETKKRIGVQEENREKLKTAVPFDEAKLRSLDSALKKTTAFMKKVKALTVATVPSATSDLSKLNLSKFVEEMAQAIAETKMKANEVNPIVDFCVEIAIRYASFPDLLLAQLKKGLPLKKTDTVANPAKLRIDLRFLCELIASGVFSKDGLQALGAALNFLTATDKTDFVNVGLICSLCRPAGWQIAGIFPRPEEGQMGVPVAQDDIPPGPVSSTHKKVMFDLLNDYRSVLLAKVDKCCAAMNVCQKRVKRQERTRGDASAEDKQQLEEKRTDFERFKTLAADLSAALGMKLKAFNEEPSDNEEDELAAMEMDRALNEGQISMWPDEETRIFYMNLLDIKNIVPKNLYRESEEPTVEPSAMETSVDAVNLDGIEKDAEHTEHPQANRSSKTPSPTLDDEHIKELLAPLTEDMKAHMNKFMLTMDHLVNREVTDEAALDFVSHLNSKGNRKRLVKLLLGCKSSRMDLVPFYARLIATLTPVMPDVAAEVATVLIQSFRKFIQRSNEADRIEEKLICVMFIGELVKFGVIPRAEALSCLRQMVYDFRWHFIDMACMLMETAGLYLYRNTDSHPKMKIILDVIKTKRERVKDVRHVMLIDNAYFSCLPPEEGPTKKRYEEPAMNVFIKQLILNVSEETVDQRIKMLRRVDWKDDGIADFCLKYLSSPWLVPYSNLPCLASTVAGLMGLSYHDWIGYHVVDAVCETIRLSLEVPGVFNQQAMAGITFLGELYNYSVCDGSIIFKVLYQLISFPEMDNDSWQDFYRVRMVCELLNVVGEFFQSGTAMKKMDYFLTYFQRFYFMKKEQWEAIMQNEMEEPCSFPSDVVAEFRGAMKQIRKNLRLPNDLSEAERAVDVLEKELKATIDMPAEEQEPDEEDNRKHHDRSLHQIMEEDEEEYNYGDKGLRAASATDSVENYEENVHVHVDPQVKQPEDDEFERELERMMADTLRHPSVPVQTPTVDMSVPSNVRQRFNRQICFADADDHRPNTPEAPKQPTNKVALMARGKANKAVLKTVTINEERLHQSWQQEREREEREREVVKRVTLGHTARIMAQEEQEEKAAAMANKRTHRPYYR